MSDAHIEDMFPLSPMQKGMLFHSLYAPTASVYFQQLHCLLEGSLDVAAFEQAWQSAVERHPILRTSFFWEELDEPLQVVSRRATLPIEVQDWSMLTESEQRTRLNAHLDADRRRGFDLTRAPLMRIALMRLDPTHFRLVWSHHHLLLDGWSMPLLLNEVFSLYAARRRGVVVELEHRRPYRDFIAWLQRQPLGEAERFWRGRMRGLTATTPLSVGRGVAAVQSTEQTATESAAAGAGAGAYESGYGERRVRLSRELTASLTEAARGQQVTLNTLVQGAWALLLSRYSGESDVVFGATVAGRPAELAGVERMLGLFINTLPVRVRVEEGEWVGAWLRRIQTEGAEARQYEHSPLVEVAGWSELPRGAQLFESLLVFDNYPVESSSQDKTAKADIPVILDVVSFKRTNYPLTLTVAPGDGMGVLISYERSRFDDETIDRMHGHYERLLTAIAADPEQRVGDLPLLTEDEHRRWLIEWNDTQAEYPRELCLHQLFEQQAARTPESVAVTFADRRLTYQELNERANQLAHYLLGLGVGAEVRVGIMLERSLEMVVAVLGVLKAGGVYVPLDPEHPSERIRFMLEDAQVSVLVTEEKMLDELPSVWAQVVSIDSDWDLIEGAGSENPPATATPANLCYVIYTSGSTGLPKGVMIPHRGVVNYLSWCAAAYAPGAGEGAPVHSPLGFDLTVTSLFAPLLSGSGVTLVDEREGIEGLAEALRSASGYSLVKLTPSHLEVLSRLLSPDEAAGRAGAFVIGGEALTTKALEFWTQHAPETRLINEYGPTEAVVGCCVYEVRGDATANGDAVPIGKPIINARAYVLDARLRPVPEGVSGELFVGGEGLARGYAGRPELTAERFVPDPFAIEPGARMYRTGDIARLVAGGELEYVGRNDAQVKVRGYRVELGEVEAVLAQHSAVDAVAVAAREDAGGGNRLVGYVVAGAGAQPDIGDLRDFAKERLPEYMVPAAWVMLEALPLTPNGKVDRSALPDPEQAGMVAVSDFVAPRSPVEEMLAEIWADVLRLERVGVNDNFFDLGGHSLLATQVISRVRQAFQVETSLNDLFDTTTLAALAENIETEIKLQHGLRTPPLIRRERSDLLPLSFAQQRLWFLDQLQPGSTAYNVRHTLRLTGRLDVTALERSLSEIVRRHEALRTRFTSVEGTPAQVIHEDLGMRLSVVDLSWIDEAEREREARRLTEEEVRRPFDLAAGPLLRATLLRLSEEEHVALFTMHHIISDAWSLGVLVREVVALYEAFSRGAESPLEELPVQYADYAEWQREWLQGEVLETHLSYWRTQLAGAPAVLELPTDRPRPRVQTDNGAAVSCGFGSELTQKLKTLSRDEGVTLFMLLLATFQLMLHRYSRQAQIVVGTPIANRRHAEIEGLIGFFTNTLVINTDLSEDPSFRELLARVREVCLGAYAHQDVPFEMLVEELQPERSLSYSPLFQVMFTLQNAPSRTLELPGLTVGSFGAESRTAKFDLNLSLRETEEGLVGGLEYNTDLFDEETIDRMVGHLESLLHGVVSDPGQRVSELPLLTEAEQRQLLFEWNDTRREYPRRQCVHELFEEQVERTPEQPALVFADERLTYRELNERANRLAHHLRPLGVGPEVRVGIMTERSAEMLIAVLGTLKAGGTYVPLDPVYPRERIGFMLADAGATVLLTHRELADEMEMADGCADAGVLVVRLDEAREELARQRKDDPRIALDGDNLAYVIYTSGSTGKPKGIGLSHRALSNLIEWHFETLSAGVKTLQFASLSFDASFHEAFSAWCSGGELLTLPESQRLDMAELARTLAEDRVEKAVLPVVVLQQLAEIYNEAGEDEHDLSGLREIITTGEQLQITTPIRKLFKRLKHCALHNHYGPSETHVVTYHVLGDDSDEWPSHPPIGRPIANTQIYLLDDNLNPVPVRVLGQVYIGGVMLARGYVNRPDLTAEKFIPNPHSSTRGARLYKTGDWARYLPDGSIEFLGRIDHQVKIRGFRVELGEIEAVLSKHDAVRECVVLAQDDGATGYKRLIAYVVAEPGNVPSVLEMRGYTRQHLPEYMVPSVFVMLDELPLTPNGKVDRRALPAPDASRGTLDAESIAPRTAAEQVVSNIFAQVLGVEGVGATDNFFELGGHSLVATRVMSRVAKVFQVEVALRRLFETPTVEGVVEALGEQWGGRDVVEEIAQTFLDIEQLPDESVEGMLAQQELEAGEPGMMKGEA